MARLNYSINDSQVEKIKKYCKRVASELSEKPGFVYRRLIYSLNLITESEMTPSQIRDGFLLLIELKNRGCSMDSARELAREIANLVLKKGK